MDLLLQRYPRLQALQMRVSIGEEQVEQERSARRPQLNFDLRAGQENFTRSEGGHMLDETSSAAFRGRQLLYDGGYARSRIDEARLQVAITNESLAKARDDLSLELATVYVDLLKFQKLVELAEKNVDVHRESLSKIEEKFTSGAGPRADALLVRGRLAKALATLEFRKRQLNAASADFAKLTGQAPNQLVEPPFPDWALPRSLVDVNAQKTPEVRSAQVALEAVAARKRSARSANRPKVDLLIEGDSTDSGRFRQRQDDAMAQLSVSYNIFDGGRRRSEIGKIEAQVAEAEWNLRNAVIEAEAKFAKAWNELVSTEERQILLDDHMNATAEVVAAYHEQFELGKRALINLLDLENELFTARSSSEEERYNRLISAYRVLAAMGELAQTIH